MKLRKEETNMKKLNLLLLLSLVSLASCEGWNSSETDSANEQTSIDAHDKEAYKQMVDRSKINYSPDFVNDPNVDVVDICCPTPDHAGLIIAALKAGKHVFAEKPFARNLEQAAEIKAAYLEAKLI